MLGIWQFRKSTYSFYLKKLEDGVCAQFQNQFIFILKKSPKPVKPLKHMLKNQNAISGIHLSH